MGGWNFAQMFGLDDPYAVSAVADVVQRRSDLYNQRLDARKQMADEEQAKRAQILDPNSAYNLALKAGTDAERTKYNPGGLMDVKAGWEEDWLKKKYAPGGSMDLAAQAKAIQEKAQRDDDINKAVEIARQTQPYKLELKAAAPGKAGGGGGGGGRRRRGGRGSSGGATNSAPGAAVKKTGGGGLHPAVMGIK